MPTPNVNVPEIGTPEWYQQWGDYGAAETAAAGLPPTTSSAPPQEKPKWEDTPEGRAQIAQHAGRRGAWMKDLNQLYRKGGIQSILDAGYDPYEVLEKMGVKAPGRIIAAYGDQFNLPGHPGTGGGNAPGHGTGGWTTDAYDLPPGVVPPEWWVAALPTEWTPETEYAAAMNSLLPYFSPEDQRTVAEYLYANYPDVFSGYNPMYVNFPVPPDVTSEDKNYYTSALYPAQVMSALANFSQAATGQGFTPGPGLEFLNQLADIMKDYGGFPGEGMTNLDFESMMAALDPLLAQSSGGDLGAWSEIARMLTQPFFSQGSVYPYYMGPNGEPIYGEPNPSFS